jgi:hypothetical protein
MEDTSLYQDWIDGKIGNFGSFQTTILEAYKIADGGNRKKLEEAYPYWFLPGYIRKERALKKNLICQIAIEFNHHKGKDFSEEDLEQFSIPFDDTAYIHLNEIPYPFTATSEDDFRQQILDMRRLPKKPEITHQKI